MKNLLTLGEVSDHFLFKEEKGENRGKGKKEDISWSVSMTSTNTPTFPGGFVINGDLFTCQVQGSLGLPPEHKLQCWY